MTKSRLLSLMLAGGLAASPLAAAAQGNIGQVPNAPGPQVPTPSTQGFTGTNQELVDLQLRLLNEFGGLGFAAMRNFQKVGAMYTAEVMMPDGTWVTVVLDPMMGIATQPAG